MLIQTILNKVHPLKSFVYKSATLHNQENPDLQFIDVKIVPRSNGRPICSCCNQQCSGYDTLPERNYEFVPLWGIKMKFRFEPRRVNCKRCGVKIEKVPWAEGKSSLTNTMKSFLASWARKMSWKDVAKSFRTSWESVFRSVKWVVGYGMERRDLTQIETIGIDEVKYKVGHKYITLVYQLDQGMKRLLHIEKDRTEECFNKFFNLLPKDVLKGVKIACTDMWKPYLNVLRNRVPQALNILDRFHIKKHLNQAIDETRKIEARYLKEKGCEPILEKSRWALLKNPENRTPKQSEKIKDLLKYNLKTVKSFLFVREFEKFWKYKSPAWAEKFLNEWTENVMRSNLPELKKKAQMIRNHQDLIMNWHHAKGMYSSGIVEGLNNKIKVTVRKSYGFRELEVLKIALYHQLGALPEPELTHKFC